MNLKKITALSFLGVFMLSSPILIAQDRTPRTIINNPNNVDRVKMYTWVDGKGVRHYTDDAKKAPSSAKSHTVTTPKVRAPIRSVARNNQTPAGLPPLPPSSQMLRPPSSEIPAGLPPLPPSVNEL